MKKAKTLLYSTLLLSTLGGPVSTITTEVVNADTVNNAIQEKLPSKFVWPVDNLTPIGSGQNFGWRDLWGSNQWHDGLDFTGAGSTYVYSATDGKVIFAGNPGPGYEPLGKAVIVIQYAGVNMIYQEFGTKMYVSAGDTVKAGQAIGKIGPNGAGTGLHLHFGMTRNDWRAQQAYAFNNKNNGWIDPSSYFNGQNYPGNTIKPSINDVSSNISNISLDGIIDKNASTYYLNNDGIKEFFSNHRFENKRLRLTKKAIIGNETYYLINNDAWINAKQITILEKLDITAQNKQYRLKNNYKTYFLGNNGMDSFTNNKEYTNKILKSTKQAVIGNKTYFLIDDGNDGFWVEDKDTTEIFKIDKSRINDSIILKKDTPLYYFEETGFKLTNNYDRWTGEKKVTFKTSFKNHTYYLVESKNEEIAWIKDTDTVWANEITQEAPTDTNGNIRSFKITHKMKDNRVVKASKHMSMRNVRASKYIHTRNGNDYLEVQQKGRVLGVVEAKKFTKENRPEKRTIIEDHVMVKDNKKIYYLENDGFKGFQSTKFSGKQEVSRKATFKGEEYYLITVNGKPACWVNVEDTDDISNYEITQRVVNDYAYVAPEGTLYYLENDGFTPWHNKGILSGVLHVSKRAKYKGQEFMLLTQNGKGVAWQLIEK